MFLTPSGSEKTTKGPEAQVSPLSMPLERASQAEGHGFETRRPLIENACCSVFDEEVVDAYQAGRLPRKNVPEPSAPVATVSIPRQRNPLRSVRSGV
jgi:hypothetical protein